jgi:hypothetical protein
VTAIIGFSCIDGVVLAADSEETYDKHLKVYTHKLFPFERKTWRAVVAGSGPAYLIDYAKDKIIAALHAGLKNENEFYESLSKILDGLYKNEFKLYPFASPEESVIQQLVGVQFFDESASLWMMPALFECQSNLVTKVKQGQSRVLGMGETVKETGVNFADWRLTAELAEWASISVIHEAKRRLGGVGGKTHVFRIMKDGTWVDRFGRGIPETEQILEILPKINQLITFSISPLVSDSKSKDLLDGVKRWLAAARKELKDLEVRRGKQKFRVIEIRNRELDKMIRQIAKLGRADAGSTQSASQKLEPEQ